ncbi:hypothetical protein A2U01_0077392, partial [Trifolium medium]|nr:hypothetical protein [Trifolium medium]
ITAFNVFRFFKRDILARFGIPRVVVTDNGMQFTDKKFREFPKPTAKQHKATAKPKPRTKSSCAA